MHSAKEKMAVAWDKTKAKLTGKHSDETALGRDTAAAQNATNTAYVPAGSAAQGGTAPAQQFSQTPELIVLPGQRAESDQLASGGMGTSGMQQSNLTQSGMPGSTQYGSGTSMPGGMGSTYSTNTPGLSQTQNLPSTSTQAAVPMGTQLTSDTGSSNMQSSGLGTSGQLNQGTAVPFGTTSTQLPADSSYTGAPGTTYSTTDPAYSSQQRPGMMQRMKEGVAEGWDDTKYTVTGGRHGYDHTTGTPGTSNLPPGTYTQQQPGMLQRTKEGIAEGWDNTKYTMTGGRHGYDHSTETPGSSNLPPGTYGSTATGPTGLSGTTGTSGLTGGPTTTGYTDYPSGTTGSGPYATGVGLPAATGYGSGTTTAPATSTAYSDTSGTDPHSSSTGGPMQKLKQKVGEALDQTKYAVTGGRHGYDHTTDTPGTKNLGTDYTGTSSGVSGAPGYSDTTGTGYTDTAGTGYTGDTSGVPAAGVRDTYAAGRPPYDTVTRDQYATGTVAGTGTAMAMAPTRTGEYSTGTTDSTATAVPSSTGTTVTDDTGTTRTDDTTGTHHGGPLQNLKEKIGEAWDNTKYALTGGKHGYDHTTGTPGTKNLNADTASGTGTDMEYRTTGTGTDTTGAGYTGAPVATAAPYSTGTSTSTGTGYTAGPESYSQGSSTTGSGTGVGERMREGLDNTKYALSSGKYGYDHQSGMPGTANLPPGVDPGSYGGAGGPSASGTAYQTSSGSGYPTTGTSTGTGYTTGPGSGYSTGYTQGSSTTGSGPGVGERMREGWDDTKYALSSGKYGYDHKSGMPGTANLPPGVDPGSYGGAGGPSASGTAYPAGSGSGYTTAAPTTGYGSGSGYTQGSTSSGSGYTQGSTGSGSGYTQGSSTTGSGMGVGERMREGLDNTKYALSSGKYGYDHKSGMPGTANLPPGVDPGSYGGAGGPTASGTAYPGGTGYTGAGSGYSGPGTTGSLLRGMDAPRERVSGGWTGSNLTGGNKQEFDYKTGQYVQPGGSMMSGSGTMSGSSMMPPGNVTSAADTTATTMRPYVGPYGRV